MKKKTRQTVVGIALNVLASSLFGWFFGVRAGLIVLVTLALVNSVYILMAQADKWPDD